MLGIRKCGRWLATPLAALIVMTSFNIGVANAGLVATDRLNQQGIEAGDREKVLEFLSRDDVRQQMIDLGVEPDEAAARVDSMSDREVAQIAPRIDSLPAGEGDVGVIVGALLLVFIILLITDIAGLTDVFDFDDSTAR